MDNLGRKEDKKEKGQSVFTKETLGVVLVLFATLIFVCLITRDKVFATPGKAISQFFLGVFGYFAYPLNLFVIFLGVLLIIGKKLNISVKKKLLISFSIIVLDILIHIITMRDFSTLKYGEYLAKCYTVAGGGISTCSGGGIITGIVAYPFSALLTNVGAYVIVGILFAISIFLIYRDAKNRTPKLNAVKFNTSYDENAEEKVKEEDSSNQSANEVVEPIKKAKHQKLYVAYKNDFSVKTKKDLKTEDGGIKFTYTDGGLGVANVTSYKAKYTEDMQSKIDYVKTPASINVNNDYGVSQNQTTISTPIDRKETYSINKEEESVIPCFEHDESEDVGVAEREQAFNDKYASAPEFDEGDISTVNSTETYPIEQPSNESASFDSDDEFISEDYSNQQDSQVQESDVNDFSANQYEQIEEVNNGEESSCEEIEKTFEDEYEKDISDKEELPKEEIVPPVISRPGLRNIFGEKEEKKEGGENTEAPAFTSRVNADRNNMFTRNSAPVSEPKVEPIVEEKPKKVVPINREYFRPPFDLLETHTPPTDQPQENHQERMDIIKQTLEEFHINVEPQNYIQGPAITRYEMSIQAGISVKKVLNFDDDLKMRLMTKDGIRIEAPIPGKNLFGVEVANKYKVTVGLKEVLEGLVGKKSKDGELMFVIGKDIVGNPISDNLAKGPHYLVAGATGSGKSVCLNVMITSLIMRYSPEELRLILIDPKQVEFSIYNHIPHLMIDDIISDPKKVIATLTWAYAEMERRFSKFKECGGMVVDIDSYNANIPSDTIPRMPKIVIIIDELADLMQSCKKDLEARICALAQKSRAAGIHLVLATQRPSVDVITGTIKANLASRIAFKVMNFQDSQTILGEQGAEKLLGNGDMLYKNSVMPDHERYQGAFISTREINNIVSYIKEHNEGYFDDDLKEYLDNAVKVKQEEQPSQTSSGEGDGEMSEANTELLKNALWFAINSGQTSISQIQRRFQIGYIRAAGLIDKMEGFGYISANEGSKARKVYITREQFEEKFGPMEE